MQSDIGTTATATPPEDASSLPSRIEADRPAGTRRRPRVDAADGAVTIAARFAVEPTANG